MNQFVVQKFFDKVYSVKKRKSLESCNSSTHVLPISYAKTRKYEIPILSIPRSYVTTVAENRENGLPDDGGFSDSSGVSRTVDGRGSRTVSRWARETAPAPQRPTRTRDPGVVSGRDSISTGRVAAAPVPRSSFGAKRARPTGARSGPRRVACAQAIVVRPTFPELIRATFPDARHALRHESHALRHEPHALRHEPHALRYEPRFLDTSNGF